MCHSDLRDGILSEGQILNQNIQTSILLVQKLSDPPTSTETDRQVTERGREGETGQRGQRERETDSQTDNDNKNISDEDDGCDEEIPDVVCAKRNLELSEHLSRFLNSSSELL